VTANKVILINQVYYIELEKSYATKELVGYTTLSTVLKKLPGLKTNLERYEDYLLREV
jgi:hypothetical protein